MLGRDCRHCESFGDWQRRCRGPGGVRPVARVCRRVVGADSPSHWVWPVAGWTGIGVGGGNPRCHARRPRRQRRRRVRKRQPGLGHRWRSVGEFTRHRGGLVAERCPVRPGRLARQCCNPAGPMDSCRAHRALGAHRGRAEPWSARSSGSCRLGGQLDRCGHRLLPVDPRPTACSPRRGHRATLGDVQDGPARCCGCDRRWWDGLVGHRWWRGRAARLVGERAPRSLRGHDFCRDRGEARQCRWFRADALGDVSSARLSRTRRRHRRVRGPVVDGVLRAASLCVRAMDPHRHGLP